MVEKVKCIDSETKVNKTKLSDHEKRQHKIIIEIKKVVFDKFK